MKNLRTVLCGTPPFIRNYHLAREGDLRRALCGWRITIEGEGSELGRYLCVRCDKIHKRSLAPIASESGGRVANGVAPDRYQPTNRPYLTIAINHRKQKPRLKTIQEVEGGKG